MGGVRSVLVRRDIWHAEFDLVRGRDQAGRRPPVIVSADRFHQGLSRLAYVVPLTRTDRGSPWHIPIQPPEGGLTAPSFIMCDQVRIFSVERLLRRRGQIDGQTLARVEDRLRVLLDL